MTTLIGNSILKNHSNKLTQGKLVLRNQLSLKCWLEATRREARSRKRGRGRGKGRGRGRDQKIRNSKHAFGTLESKGDQDQRHRNSKHKHRYCKNMRKKT